MKKIKKNYLDFVPVRKADINFTVDANGIVILEMENNGLFNKVFQIILRKPKISFIHLDELGSFIWCQIDDKSSIFEISEKVKEEFGDKAEPLHQRIVKFMEILKNNKFIALIG